MLNADMSIAALVYSASMERQFSPSFTVSRKRFHLTGEAESLQVISIKFEGGCEGFVLEGDVNVNGSDLGQFDWFRFPVGDNFRVLSQGYSPYLKFGAVSQLWSHP
jgi:hypothetical protein